MPARPFRPHAAGRHDQRGAALLILLTVMVLAASALLLAALGRGNTEAARQARTVVALAQAREALIGYALRHGRLPRPARSATEGDENPLPCVSEQMCTGYLPWTALGVGATDAWGKLLRYSVTPAFTVAPLHAETAVASKFVQGRSGAGLVDLAGQPVCTLQRQCVPAVILSTGRDNFGTSTLGLEQANGASGNLDEQANAASSRGFVRRAASDAQGAGGPYDDLLDWVPLQLLLFRMGVAGALP